MDVLTKPEAAKFTNKQLDAIKNQAVKLWGDDWEAKLCNAYEQKNGYKHRSRNSKVRAWFDHSYKPTLTSFNELLIATNCEMKIISREEIL